LTHLSRILFNYKEVLKWQRDVRRKQQKRQHLRRKQRRKKIKGLMGVNPQKAITANAVMAFLFAVKN